MTIVSLPLLLVWAAVTAGAVVLLVWRILVAKQDFLRISPDDSQVVEEEMKLGGKLKRLDFWGKALTAASVAMVIVTLAVTLFRVMANG
jgi:hypothetical protein